MVDSNAIDFVLINLNSIIYSRYFSLIFFMCFLYFAFYFFFNAYDAVLK